MCYRWAWALVFLLASPTQAADELAFGPVPPWVAAQPVPAAAASSDAAVTFLIFDNQAKLEPGMAASYSHYAVRINNSQGLAAGNIVASWNPAFDKLTVHRVMIRRGDQQIDVLGKGQKFTVIRREQDLEQQMLNGQLTATLQPEGLQVGDIMEVETSIIHRDPTLGDHMELNGSFNFPMRVELASLRFIAPAKLTIRSRLTGDLKAPIVTEKGGENISTWTMSPLVPQTGPAFAPPRYANSRSVEFTDFQSWNDLAALFVPLFERASQIPGDSALRPEIERIRAASPDPAKRAELALQLVEEKVRYVSLALGIGGLVPASANETWRRRFGDCKAKTALLIGLLRELDIQAVPILVNTGSGDGLNERLPMVDLFDHVIVRAEVAGKTYWLDSTRTGDVSLTTLDVPFYHWGLPVVHNSSLVSIKPEPRTRPDMETLIRTDASAGASKPAPTVLDIIMRGDLALVQNNLMSGLDPSFRDQVMRKQLQDPLDRFEIDKVSGAYDAATKTYRLHGEGRQTLDLNAGIYWTEVPSPGYEADFARSGTRNRDAPVQINYPSFNRTMQVITLPKDRVSRTTFKVAPIATTVAGVEYHRTVTNEGGVVTIDATSRSLVPEISYAEALSAQNRLRDLDDDNIWIRFSDSTPVAAEDVKQLIGHDAKSADDYFQASLKFMNSEKPAEALGALDKAIEMAPRRNEFRTMRAQLRMGAGDLDGARDDALESLKSDPKSASTRGLLATIYMQKGDSEAAYAQAKSLEKVDNAAAQLTLGRILVSIGRPNEALAAYDRALSFEKDPLTHFYRAMALPAADKQARTRELESALKLSPSDPVALSGLAELASQLGDHARALQLLDQAFLKSPDNIGIRNLRAIEMQLAGKADAARKEFDAIAAKDLTATELNQLCWAKALSNVALERALDECDRSLAKAESFATHDSKAMVLYRQSRFDEAIKEFGIAIADNPQAASLYGRALAFARKGDKAKSDADAAQARKLQPDIDRTYAYYGLGL